MGSTRWRLLIFATVSKDIAEEVWQALGELAESAPFESVSTVAFVDMPSVLEQGTQLKELGTLKPWADARTIRHVGPGTFEFVDRDRDGPVLIGTADCLAGFLRRWIPTDSPERVALVILGHGQAWQGIGLDNDPAPPEGHAQDVQLTPAEIGEAIGSALPPRADGTPRVDLLGLCACNMAAVEVLACLHEHARCIVASEDVIFAENWSFGSLAGLFASGPGAPASTLGGELLRQSRGFNRRVIDEGEDHPTRRIVSVLSLLSSAAVPRLLDEISRFGRAFADAFAGPHGPTPASQALQAARDECDEFNSTCWGGGRGQCSAEAKGHAQVDLRQLLARLSHRTRAERLSPEQRDAIQSLRRALDRTILDRTRNPYLDQVGGLGIYFPGGKSEFMSGLYRNAVSPGLDGWRSFILDRWAPLAGDVAEPPLLEPDEGVFAVLEPFGQSYTPARAPNPQETAAEERPLFGFTFGSRTLGVIPGYPFYQKRLRRVYVPPGFAGDWHALEIAGHSRFIPIVGAGLNRRGRTRFWVEAGAWIRRPGWPEEVRVVLGFNLQLRGGGVFAYAGRVVGSGDARRRIPFSVRDGDEIRMTAYQAHPDSPDPFEPLPLGFQDPDVADEGLSTTPLVVTSRSAIRVVRRKLPKPGGVLLGMERWRGSRVLLRSVTAPLPL